MIRAYSLFISIIDFAYLLINTKKWTLNFGLQFYAQPLSHSFKCNDFRLLPLKQDDV